MFAAIKKSKVSGSIPNHLEVTLVASFSKHCRRITTNKLRLMRLKYVVLVEQKMMRMPFDCTLVNGKLPVVFTTIFE